MFLMGKHEDLVDVEKRMSDILQQCNLDSFVSVDTIKMWITDIEDEDSMTPVKMLTGLLDKETLEDNDVLQELINTTISLSHLLPAKALDGETFSDVLKKRGKQGEPSRVYLTQTTIPPMEWSEYYNNAMYDMRKQKFFDASKNFDKTFEKLLETKTTDQNIYRFFCNAGISYLLTGKPLIGINCFEMAHELNPQYSFASEQLQKYHQGKFDSFIEFGYLTEMKNNFEEWERRADYLHFDNVMKWSEKKILEKLSLFGVTVDKDEFIDVAKTVNLTDELAENLFYPQTHISGKDEDFIWIAAYALWDMYCPDEPSISGFNDTIHKAFTFVSKTDVRNKSKKKIQEAFQKTCFEYLKTLQKYVFSNKNGFLQAWQKIIDDAMDPPFELKTILTSLLSIPKLEENVLDIVHHLNTQIPHPDWRGVEIISNIRHNNSRGEELYNELKRDHPFYCYVACDIANYYMEKKDFLHAEFYLIDALKIVDARTEKNKLSIDTIETTIYDDYTNVFNLLKEVFDKSNADSKKRKILKTKIREVKKKSELYSKSPKIEKMDHAINELFTRFETEQTENSYAVQYYNYLTQFEINFETEEPVKVDKSLINILPESYLDSKDTEKKDHWKKRTSKKIGRNDPCPCGSGRKYKKCCGAIVKK